MTLKTVLDDVAAEATRDLRIDLSDVYERTASRRREVRRRAASVMATAVAVAATIAVAVVLLPGSSPKAIQPAAGPTGIPDRWFYSPPWTPPVTRHPMAAASMVVSSNLTTGVAWNPVGGAVLVSADGKQYASLPWTKDDKLVTLSRDGTRVAWVTQGVGRPTVHQLVLATGERRDDKLLGSQSLAQLVWAGHRLYGTRPNRGTLAFASNGSTVICECAPPAMSADAQGRLLQPKEALVPGAAVNEGLSAADFSDDDLRIANSKAVSSPDGTQAAVALHDEKDQYWLSIEGPGGHQIQMEGRGPVTDARVLAWGPGGVVVRTTTTDPQYGPARSLRLYDPVSGAFRIISKPSSTSFDVLAVADDLVAQAGLKAVRPEFSTTDRSHLRFQIGRGWSAFGGYVKDAAFVLVVLLAAFLWWRLRRRRDTDGRDEPAHASGGADPAGDGG